jgi:hypothetical protein
MAAKNKWVTKAFKKPITVIELQTVHEDYVVGSGSPRSSPGFRYTAVGKPT